MAPSLARLRWYYFGDEGGYAALAFTPCGVLALLLISLGYRSALESDRAREDQARAFRQRGRAVQGTVAMRGTRSVTDTMRRGGRRMPGRRTIYEVTYLYPAAGRVLEGRGTVSRSEFDRLRPRGPIPVQFLPEAPLVSRIAFRPAEALPPAHRAVVVVAAVTGLAGSLALGFAARAFRVSGRRARLVREGVPAPGAIRRVEEESSGAKDGAARRSYLHYRYFAAADGAWHEGRSPALPARLVGRWSEGDAILILHDASAPDRHEPDLYGVRPAGGGPGT